MPRVSIDRNLCKGCELCVGACPQQVLAMSPKINIKGYFPAEAQWAEPDLDQAAAAIVRIADDAGLRTRLAAAGRARMQKQPSLAETGRMIARLAGGST